MLLSCKQCILLFLQVVVEIPKSAETPFPLPLEEGVPYEIYTKFLAPPEEEFPMVYTYSMFKIQCINNLS